MPDLNWLFPGTVVQPSGPQPMQNPGGMGLMPAAPAMLPPNAMREEDMTVSYPTRFPNDTYYGNNMQSAGGAAIANPALINQGGGRFEEDGGVSYPQTYRAFMSPRSMQTFQETPPPPSPPTSSGGGTYNAGNGGGVFGSANGGTIQNGAILINGVYYPIANGGTVIGSADGGSGNSATSTTSMGGPSAPPSGPPPGAISDPNGGPPSPDAMRSFMAPQRTMPTPVPPPPSPLTRPTKPGPSLPPYITDPGFAAPPYRPPFNQQQSPFPAPPKYGY